VGDEEDADAVAGGMFSAEITEGMTEIRRAPERRRKGNLRWGDISKS
jgi:hypothetical protein